MLPRLDRLPFIVPLAWIFAAAMLLPALQALHLGQTSLAGGFAGTAAALALLALIVALAVPPMPPERGARDVLATLTATLSVLPFALALPLLHALPDTGLLNAWWEMVSCLTATGGSLYEPRLLPAPLHLWRGLVGWLGGLLTLVSAASLLAPLGIGGFELTASGRQRRPSAPRAFAAMRAILPIYAGLTLCLWVLLQASGAGTFRALMLAMGTISTSGISSGAGLPGDKIGLGGEAVLMLGMLPALSRRFWPGGAAITVSRRWRDDPELRLAAGAIAAAAILLMARALVVDVSEDAMIGREVTDAAAALWGALFNGLSFLTTTGWTSASWGQAQAWSGMTSPGLLLAGLAIMGGGVATAAGGVKLLRVHVLAIHAAREMERIVHPASVAGGGAMTRRLRREGSGLAFVVFMLFALSCAVVILALSLGTVAFETATMLAVSSLTNTGPLASTIPLSTALEGTAGAAGAPWQGWAGLSDWGKAVTAAAMIVGRVETLAILAMLSPVFWRR